METKKNAENFLSLGMNFLGMIEPEVWLFHSSTSPEKKNKRATKKNLGWLGYIGDYTSIRVPINQPV